MRNTTEAQIELSECAFLTQTAMMTKIAHPHRHDASSSSATVAGVKNIVVHKFVCN